MLVVGWWSDTLCDTTSRELNAALCLLRMALNCDTNSAKIKKSRFTRFSVQHGNSRSIMLRLYNFRDIERWVAEPNAALYLSERRVNENN